MAPSGPPGVGASRGLLGVVREAESSRADPGATAARGGQPEPASACPDEAGHRHASGLSSRRGGRKMTVFVTFRVPLALVRPPADSRPRRLRGCRGSTPTRAEVKWPGALARDRVWYQCGGNGLELEPEGSEIHGAGPNLPRAPVRRAGPAISWAHAAQVVSRTRASAVPTPSGPSPIRFGRRVGRPLGNSTDPGRRSGTGATAPGVERRQSRASSPAEARSLTLPAVPGSPDSQIEGAR